MAVHKFVLIQRDHGLLVRKWCWWLSFHHGNGSIGRSEKDVEIMQAIVEVIISKIENIDYKVDTLRSMWRIQLFQC